MGFDRRRTSTKISDFDSPRRMNHSGVIPSIQEVTRGFIEDIALRERYEKEGFGLETVFEKQEWAEVRIMELRQTWALTDDDIRLVKHISTPETDEKSTWEVYVKAGKGLPVLFLYPNKGDKSAAQSE